MYIGGFDGHPLVLDLPAACHRIRLSLAGAKPRQLALDRVEVLAGGGANLHDVAPRGRVAATDPAATTTAEAVLVRERPGKPSYRSIPDTAPFWELELPEDAAAHTLVVHGALARPRLALRGLRVEVITRTGTDWLALFRQDDQGGATELLATRLGHLEDRLRSAQEWGRPTLATSAHVLGTPADLNAYYLRLHQIRDLRDLCVSLRSVLDADSRPGGPGGLIPYIAALRSLVSGLDAFPRVRAVPTSLGEGSSLAIRWDGRPLAPDVRYFTLDDLASATAGGEKGPATGIQRALRLPYVEELEPPSRSSVLEVGFDQPTSWSLVESPSDGSLRVLFESSLVADAVLDLQYAVDSIWGRSFDGLCNMTGALEATGRYRAANLLSRSYAVPEPEEADVARYLARVEIMSAADKSRKSVSRTKHGYRSTFLFRTKKLQAIGLRRVIDRCAAFGFTVIPSYGTLLGMVREGTFLDHDDDHDVLLLSEVESMDALIELRAELRETFKRRTKWRVYTSDFAGKHVPVGFKVKGEYVHTDIFPTFLNDEGQVMAMHSRELKFKSLDPSIFDEMTTIEIAGTSFEIPARSDELLSDWYGDSWSVPRTNYMLGYRWTR